MSTEPHPYDPERPVDQFVDEVCDRISELHALLDLDRDGVDPMIARRAAHKVLTALRSDRAPDVASQLVTALWSTTRGGHVPAGWLTTPLGELVDRTRQLQISQAQLTVG